MQWNIFKKRFSELQVEAHWSRITVLGLLVLCVVLTFALANKTPVVLVQPWTLTSDAEITQSHASRSYKEAWALAIAELVGNVQPTTVDFVGERLKPLLSPEIYHEVIDAIQANAQMLRDDRVSIRFEPREVIYEKSTDKVFVFGYSFMRLGTSLEKEVRTPRTYEIALKIANYAPMITFITTYQGRPMTRDEIERQEKGEQRQIEREKKQAERMGLKYEPKKVEKKE